jgi:hypothetical protein
VGGGQVISRGGKLKNPGCTLTLTLRIPGKIQLLMTFCFSYCKDFFSIIESRFKLIPTVIEGNFMVRSVMPGALPCLLGQKIQQRYFKGSNFISLCGKYIF